MNKDMRFALSLALVAFFGLGVIGFMDTIGYAVEKDDPPAVNLHEEWFEVAEQDDWQDPLESEHIQQAIYELPDKRYPLTDEELYLLCGVVMAEAGGESYEGQMAVAQCLLNACERSEVRPAEAVEEYQYTSPAQDWTDSVWHAVTAVFFEGQTVTDAEILWFYAPALSTGAWHETQQFVMELGGHRFFAEVTP